jgi:peptidoglycan/xylan/chitin deacetylase (PgdA/CDA1 family)
MPLIAYDYADRNSNKIALTFDDGPNPFWTIKVLDVLDKYNVKANFFVLGKWAEKNPDIVKETFNRGHLVGNHTYSHPREGLGDFEKTEEIIFNIIGEHTKFIRPPYNSINLCNNYTPALSGDVKIINNEVAPGDWKYNSEIILDVIRKQTQNGSIIVLHDGSHREEEIEIRPLEMFKSLPEILKILKKKFEIVRLDELTFK